MAGTFDIQYSQGTPGIVQQPRANLNVDTGGQAIGQAFAGLGERLFQFGQQKQQAQNALDLSKQKRLYDETNLAAYNALQNVTDDAEAEKILSQYQADVGKLKTGNQAVDSQFDMHINDTITGVTESFGKRLETNKIKKLNDEFEINYQGYLETGDYNSAAELVDQLQQSGAITKVVADDRKKTFFGDTMLAQANRMIALGDATNLKKAGNILATLPELKKSDGKNLELTTLQLDMRQKLTKELMKKAETVNEESHKQLSDLMAADKLSVLEVQKRRDGLSAEDYEQWTKIAISPVAKPGNTIAETSLKSAAIDVWRGTISKKDFDAKVRASMADPNGINDKQYAAVMSDADKELKQVQAEDMRRFSKDAANVILGQYSGLMQFDAMGNLVGVNMAGLSGDQTEDLKYRMHFHSLYEQGLRDYIATHPDASGKDFYLFAREQKMRYWNTSLEQMKAIAKELPPVTPGTPLDIDTARLLLQQSGGNRQQAEQKAKDLGYTF